MRRTPPRIERAALVGRPAVPDVLPTLSPEHVLRALTRAIETCQYGDPVLRMTVESFALHPHVGVLPAEQVLAMVAELLRQHAPDTLRTEELHAIRLQVGTWVLDAHGRFRRA